MKVKLFVSLALPAAFFLFSFHRFVRGLFSGSYIHCEVWIRTNGWCNGESSFRSLCWCSTHNLFSRLRCALDWCCRSVWEVGVFAIWPTHITKHWVPFWRYCDALHAVWYGWYQVRRRGACGWFENGNHLQHEYRCRKDIDWACSTNNVIIFIITNKITLLGRGFTAMWSVGSVNWESREM